MTPLQRPEHAVTVDFRVAFHQCDPLGVVWHGRYFEFFEVARSALMATVGLDVPDLRALGFQMYVTEVNCRYMLPLALGDALRVSAWFSAVTPLIRVAYDVRDPAGQRWYSRATTVLATTDRNGCLIPRTPDELLARLPAR